MGGETGTGDPGTGRLEGAGKGKLGSRSNISVDGTPVAHVGPASWGRRAQALFGQEAPGASPSTLPDRRGGRAQTTLARESTEGVIQGL